MNTKTPIVIYCDVDAEVKDMIVRHGVAAQLEPRKEWPVKDGFRIHIGWRDADYAYVACRYFGYAKPEDNGYAMISILISSCTPQEIVAIVREFVTHGATGPGFFEEFDANTAVAAN